MTEEKDTVNKSETKKGVAEEIWEEIRRLPIEMYALPGQKVEDHITKLGAHGDSLIVRPKSPAALPALEAVLDDKYQIQTAEGGYIMVCRTPSPLVDEEEEYILFPRPNGHVDKVPRKKLYNS
jgi:hypothetical protein